MSFPTCEMLARTRQVILAEKRQNTKRHMQAVPVKCEQNLEPYRGKRLDVLDKRLAPFEKVGTVNTTSISARRHQNVSRLMSRQFFDSCMPIMHYRVVRHHPAFENVQYRSDVTNSAYCRHQRHPVYFEESRNLGVVCGTAAQKTLFTPIACGDW